MYEFDLPVYKQGDDYAEELAKSNGDGIAALCSLAACYEDAAQTCRSLAARIEGEQDIEVQGDTHSIWLEGPDVVLGPLAAGDDAVISPLLRD